MNVSVAEVMSEHVIAVRQKAAFAEIVAVMRRYHIASMPVIDEDNRVVGLISEHDLLLKETGGGGLMRWWRRRAENRKRAGVTAGELMTSPAVTVTAATPVREAARVMYRGRVRQLPVVDPASGRLRGILTRSDLLGVYERPDEDLHREVLNEVLEDAFGMDPGRFAVTVDHGTVTIGGMVERRSIVPAVVAAIQAVDGVVAVDSHLTYRWDDSAPMPRVRL